MTERATNGRLEGRVAIITGSTSGIGRETAQVFAREGARVVVNGRRRELGEAVVEGIRAEGGEAAYCPADITNRDEIEGLIEFALETYGTLDILMNNAWSGKLASILDTSEEEWDYLFDATLKATFLATKLALPTMLEQGRGNIINVSSVHGVLAARNYAPYDAAKAAIIQLTRQTAVDYGHQGVRANAICPGWIIVEKSRAHAARNEAHMRLTEEIYPVGRPGYPIDIAKAALFLASDDSSFITGHALMVDGGLTIQLQDSLAAGVRRMVEGE